ncbi:MAG: MoxR family ATPase [SAR324 cluster bacterium]|uniref:MoxR family ATPase n=1 Tax=SAR324 cluster bacterium TaxID=2024889 RepID=A0A7X9IJT4_9DELT|nr:MoxR family ATPase [SAR324 cluster bacterium]
MTDISSAFETGEKLRGALSKIIRGRDDTIRLVLTALFADGHVLLEDYPGSGKTILSKSLGNLIAKDSGSATEEYILPFRRIQFTPDMLPGDVLGVNVFEAQTGHFHFLHGPIFAHVVLADEINRTGPKVQAAFLECMAEKQVTIDNVTYPLDKLFFVIGTQNPLDIAGTYPLPLVQLDRFLLKIPMSYVDAKTEVEILEQHHEIQSSIENIRPICTRSDIISARELCNSVHLSPAMREAIVAIVQSTRQNPAIQFGASTRAALMLQGAIKAWALLQGRDYANEDDLKTLAPFVLMHRLRFHGGNGDPISFLREIMAPSLEKLIRKGI